MKKILLLTLMLTCFNLNSEAQNQDPYVCTPCGYECDGAEHSGPGQCGSCGMAFVKKSTVHFDNIDFSEMCNRVKANKNIVLLDVRSPGEFSGETRQVPSFGHFKNAINISVDELGNRLDELSRYKDSEVIVYCSHSHRSPRATYLLTNSGFQNVANVSGGVSIMKQEFGDNSCLRDIYVQHEY